ncbi:uncharacterized protein LOC101850275 [Aplysia californica]|uniref:Uncharacterized protein LOC101850275 n=1 Tax=Aplysia californica TaxID=6500 RepID=A0ABM0K111_APLCA|nr:uncharacterized protein LOC101850275 [Aplysia californica]
MDDNQSSTQIPGTPVVKYHRRLDRGPDKHFQKLNGDSKVLLSTLRGALEEAKNRIVRLRDENDEKDEIIDEERKMRRDAEHRLQKYLVDLYNNPDVNGELRSRLPRAKKKDPLSELDSDFGGHETNDDTEGLQDDTVGGSRNDVSVTSDKEDGSQMRKSKLARLSENGMEIDTVSHSGISALHDPVTGEQVVVPGPGESGQGTDGTGVLLADNTGMHERKADSIATSLAESSGYLGLPSPHTSPVWQASVADSLPPIMNPLTSGSQVLSASSSYQALPTRQGLGDVNGDDGVREQVEHILNGGGLANPDQQVPSVSPDHPPVLQMTTTVTSPVSVGGGNVLPSAVSQSGVYSTPLTHHHQHHRPGMHSAPLLQGGVYPTPPLYYGSVYVPPSSLTHTGLLATPPITSMRTGGVPDHVSHISRLLVEIATLKKENEELKSELKDAKRDLEILKSDARSDVDESLEQIGVLIEEVHAAEKIRDAAMTQMIRSADDDRDATLGELDRMRLRSVNRSDPFLVSETEVSDDDIDDGIENTSGSSLNLSGGNAPVNKRRSLQHMERMLAKQREVMKQQMQLVIGQRDSARSQVAKLEKKLSTLELTGLNGPSDNRVKAKLKIVEQERDMVVAKLKFLMQDVKETALLSNLEKALLTDDPSNNLSSYQDGKEKKNADSEFNKNNNVAAQLTQHAEDKAKLEAQLAILENEKLAQANQIKKLEQLVTRQRHKLNTLCAGPLLMEENK